MNGWSKKSFAFFQFPLIALVSLPLLFPFFFPTSAQSRSLQHLDKRIGPRDAVMVTDETGTVIYAKNENKKLIPASTLKLLTALTAFHWLGTDFRFSTDFFLNSQDDLVIKGYGDPMLVSEEVDNICRRLAAGISTVKDLVLDDGFFTDPLTIPGVSNTSQPYDAPNGALCVNFNTVFFKTAGNRFVSAEPQTPLLPFALPKIRSSGMKKGRITFSHQHRETTLYAGEMFRYFLEKNGVAVRGRIRIGAMHGEKEPELVLHHLSSLSLPRIVSGLMAHSNNFIANQLLITAGATAYGTPGNLKKAVKAMNAYAKGVLGLKGVQLDEGSGISRKNRISASEMLVVLEHFRPHAPLLKKNGRELFKTGSLNGIRTRAGYIHSENGGYYRYAVMLNTPGKTTDAIIAALLAGLP